MPKLIYPGPHDQVVVEVAGVKPFTADIGEQTEVPASLVDQLRAQGWTDVPGDKTKKKEG